MTNKDKHQNYRRIIQEDYPEFKNCPYVRMNDERISRCMDRAREIVNTIRSDSMNPHQTYDARVATRTTGLLGEMAFADYYGYSTVMQSDIEGDGGFDFFVHLTEQDLTVKIDVKTRCRYMADLLMPKDHELNANLYYLLERRGDKIGIVGFATKNQMQKAPIKDFDSESRMVERKLLHDPYDQENLNILEG